MTEVKILTQTVMLCQPKQHESGAKKGKTLLGELSQDYFLDGGQLSFVVMWAALHFF